jgi:hypothetical protein
MHYDSVALHESEEVDADVCISDKTNMVDIGRGAHREDICMLIL